VYNILNTQLTPDENTSRQIQLEMGAGAESNPMFQC
jgi:hypothetical protein